MQEIFIIPTTPKCRDIIRSLMPHTGVEEIVAIIGAAIAAGGEAYSLNQQNSARQDARTADRKTLAAKTASDLAAKKATLAGSAHTPQNFPGIAQAIQGSVTGLEESGMGGLNPGYLASASATAAGQPGFTDLAQQIINQTLNPGQPQPGGLTNG